MLSNETHNHTHWSYIMNTEETVKNTSDDQIVVKRGRPRLTEEQKAKKHVTKNFSHELRNLEQRVNDIYSGALGDKDEQQVGVQQLSRIIPAMQKTFSVDKRKRNEAFSFAHLDKFVTARKASEHLFKNGYRA